LLTWRCRILRQAFWLLSSKRSQRVQVIATVQRCLFRWKSAWRLRLASYWRRWISTVIDGRHSCLALQASLAAKDAAQRFAMGQAGSVLHAAGNCWRTKALNIAWRRLRFNHRPRILLKKSLSRKHRNFLQMAFVKLYRVTVFERQQQQRESIQIQKAANHLQTALLIGAQTTSMALAWATWRVQVQSVVQQSHLAQIEALQKESLSLRAMNDELKAWNAEAAHRIRGQQKAVKTAAIHMKLLETKKEEMSILQNRLSNLQAREQIHQHEAATVAQQARTQADQTVILQHAAKEAAMTRRALQNRESALDARERTIAARELKMRDVKSCLADTASRLALAETAIHRYKRENIKAQSQDKTEPWPIVYDPLRRWLEKRELDMLARLHHSDDDVLGKRTNTWTKHKPVVSTSCAHKRIEEPERVKDGINGQSASLTTDQIEACAMDNMPRLICKFKFYHRKGHQPY